jgi:hypothetical protein
LLCLQQDLTTVDAGLRFNKEKWLLKVNDEVMIHL